MLRSKDYTLVDCAVIIAAAMFVGAGILPLWANNFHGYFCPGLRISPMKDDIAYSPVGLGIVTSRAGFRIHPITGHGDFHSGVDLAANLNDRVYNLLPGMVTRVGWRGALGVAVEVYHWYPNVRTICGHLNAVTVSPGDFVGRGQVIGFAGSTGRSTGVHVHYTVIREDTKQYVEPLAFLIEVPKYLAAMKTAKARSVIARNMQKHKDHTLAIKSAGSDKVRSNGDDLPANSGEVKPPPADQPSAD